MIGFSLNDEQRMYRETARAFAINEVAPVARAIRDSSGQTDKTP